jgi:hypothetical protein
MAPKDNVDVVVVWTRQNYYSTHPSNSFTLSNISQKIFQLDKLYNINNIIIIGENNNVI